MSVSILTPDHTLSTKNNKVRSLSELERKLVLLTQQGLPLVAKPYNWLAQELNVSLGECLKTLQQMQDDKIIRRIAAVPNHYKLGYKFNGMTVWDVNDEHARELGKMMGDLQFVSHCYLRPRHLPSWPYNLFAMVHGKTLEEMEHFRSLIRDLLGDELRQDDVLKSSRILKKTGLRLSTQKSQGEKHVSN